MVAQKSSFRPEWRGRAKCETIATIRNTYPVPLFIWRFDNKLNCILSFGNAEIYGPFGRADQ